MSVSYCTRWILKCMLRERRRSRTTTDVTLTDNGKSIYAYNCTIFHTTAQCGENIQLSSGSWKCEKIILPNIILKVDFGTSALITCVNR